MEHLPWPYGVGLPPRFDDLADAVAFGRRWQGDPGGPAAGWASSPVEWADHVCRARSNYVVIEELARARAPDLVGRIGINLVGPAWPAGRRRRRSASSPRILSASELWCSY